MKKLILPLVLLFAFGMLAAVESDPSDVVGYVKYDLLTGNNVIALAMEQPYAMASEVGDAIPGCTAVRWYNAAEQGWVSCTKFLGSWPAATDFAVANGDALMVYTNTAGPFYSIGDLPASPLPTYDLLAGNNVVMIPLDQSTLNMASNVGDTIPGCTAVRWYNAVEQGWVSCTKFLGSWPAATDFATQIADPLMVYTSTAGTWPAPARGARTFGTPSK